MEKELICIVCPAGCHLKVNIEDGDVLSVDGYGCKRGIDYGKEESISPKRVLTTTVKIDSKDLKRVSVKSSKPIDRNDLFFVLDKLKDLKVKPPIYVGDIIFENIDQGIDIVSTGEVLT